MAADQKLTELKIAYADMILNTAKEAAARIMVSERRAFRLESELKNSKEEAIRMLTRLKQMMDSKISEAEMSSLAQQKKIEELEAQLQEAEDIVKDLREELSVVQAELERVSAREEVKPTLQVYEAFEKNAFSNPDSIAFPPPEEQPHVVPPSDLGNSDKDQDDNGQRSYNTLFPFRKSCINDQDLPSIILRSKGTTLYKSGCTQRIRACEQTNRVMPDMITKADEGEKLHKAVSLGGERKRSRKRANPNTKKRTPCPNQLVDQVKKVDHVTDNSNLTTSRSVERSIRKKPDGSIKTGTDLVKVSDVRRRIFEELQLVGDQEPELPLSSVDPPADSKALEATGGVTVQPTSSRVIMYTFQRKRKRGTMSTDGSDLKKKKEENKTAPSETEKPISMEESTQEETAKVISAEESTEVGAEKVISTEESTEEERRLEQVAQQLICLSEKVVALEKQMQL